MKSSCITTGTRLYTSRLSSKDPTTPDDVRKKAPAPFQEPELLLLHIVSIHGKVSD